MFFFASLGGRDEESAIDLFDFALTRRIMIVIPNKQK
jgi:hypothetical protein